MNRYNIIEADLKINKDDIVSILKSNLTEASTQRYEWNYENCPYGLARCFLAEYVNSNSFVGSVALFPRKIIINNEPVYVYIVGDFAFDKNHRTYGPALKLQRRVQSEFRNTQYKFIYGNPNKISETIFLKIGFQEIGNIKLFIKILKIKYIHKYYLSLYFHSNIILGAINFLTSYEMFSKIIDFFIKKISKEQQNKKNFNYSVEIPEIFDKRFDIFWKEVSKQYKIIGQRDSIFLNWRYIESPSQDYKIFCILNGEKNILGYIIYYVKDNICYIVDMLFFKSKNILDALFKEFSLYIRKKNVGAIVIRYLGDLLIENKLKEYNFFSIENDKTKIVIYGSEILNKPYLLNKQNWHFFIGDTDL